MSKKPSIRQRQPSSDAPEVDPPAGTRPFSGPLEAAVSQSLSSGAIGYVWVDANLTVREVFGPLVEFVVLDQPLIASMLPLFGLEEQIDDLRRRPETTVLVPNVSIVRPGGPTPRFDMVMRWLPSHDAYVLTVTLTQTTSELEVELTRQSRTRQIMEAQLLENARAIERANRDLAEFAYIISHDLKAPMRALRYHIEDLEQDLGDGAPATALSHMASVKSQTRRMAQMLTDLLAYSRVGRKDETFEQVDTGRLVDEIVTSLPRPPALSVEISGIWPTIETSAAMLDLVLRNLIENAIKHGGCGKRIVLGCEPGDHHVRFSVADLGPGIAPEHHDAVFKPFLRLSSDGEGSGIGLAIVRKAVETMGAKIALQSDPVQRPGATIIVDWPRHPKRGATTVVPKPV
jgi:signal transduction histidine kinase